MAKAAKIADVLADRGDVIVRKRTPNSNTKKYNKMRSPQNKCREYTSRNFINPPFESKQRLRKSVLILEGPDIYANFTMS